MHGGGNQCNEGDFDAREAVESPDSLAMASA